MASKSPQASTVERQAGSAVSAGGAASAAAWAFAFLVLRLFAVSGYDWQTTFAVSTTLSVNEGVALLFGSLMAGHLVVAVLLTLVLPLLVAVYLWSPRGHRTVVVLPGALSLVALVALTVSFRFWWLPVATLAVLGMFTLIRRLPPGHRVHQVAAGVMTRVGSVAGVALLLVAAFVQTPWVPRERIVTTTGDTITGYVLSVDPGYLNVLTDTHTFLILDQRDVLSRQ